jgi:hypothetical protein
LVRQRSDGHYKLVCIMQMASGFRGPHLTGTLHQNAGNDLEAVRDSMLKLLEQDGFLLQQIVLQLLSNACIGDVQHWYKQPGAFFTAIRDFFSRLEPNDGPPNR